MERWIVMLGLLVAIALSVEVAARERGSLGLLALAVLVGFGPLFIANFRRRSE